ncbi:hypothetical protein NE237_021406 [Protea cynaroides]|uniref:DNL-type domain-containing protein n=1 Tax=Protea cynaroides TaxID=273540 RepID=A0A9Q0HA76_9MAGN|nr:hypothetical protein NE237_021406 [Protea cynaroides]
MAPTLCSSTVTAAIYSLCAFRSPLRPPDPTFSFFAFKFRPSFASINTIGLTSLRISHRAATTPRLRAVKGDDVFEFEVSPKQESEPLAVPPPSQDDCPEATIDLKLPRRSLMVHFTCDACGERTQRLINRLAYERGTVFVQCAGCLQHHKLVDNLGLVLEYDLREDMEKDVNVDQL